MYSFADVRCNIFCTTSDLCIRFWFYIPRNTHLIPLFENHRKQDEFFAIWWPEIYLPLVSCIHYCLVGAIKFTLNKTTTSENHFFM